MSYFLLKMADGDINSKDSHRSIENNSNMVDITINHSAQKYPFCIVWTPIPFLTWFFPFIGHMGIGMSSGIIRDFSAPYHVSTGNMGFGRPTKYWRLDPSLAVGGVEGWDKAVTEASDIYKNRNHNLFCDNCHSHVGLALTKMHYKNSSRWNMVKLAILIFIYGKFVNFNAFLKTWAPFFVIVIICLIFAFCIH